MTHFLMALRNQGLLIILIFIILGPTTSGQVIVKHPVRFDESLPLSAALFRERAVVQAPYRELYKSAPLKERNAVGNETAVSIEQTEMGTQPPAEVVSSFDGLGYGFAGPEGTARMGNPSDNSLAVGPDHIIQIVNSRMAVFTKEGGRFNRTGHVLYGPAETRNVFRGFGGACEKNNNGDAVARYDQLADRWLIVMPIFRKSEEGTYSMCYAVSKTPDPFGPYYRYEYMRELFPDYPRPAVWPDGYYVTTSTGDHVIQKHAAVVDRSRMLKGEEATEHMFIVDSVNFLINADLEGKQLPPAGAPNVMMAAGGMQLKKILGDDGIYAWKFHVDWNNPKKSTLIGPAKLAVAPYQYLGGGQLTEAVPQPGTSQRLDSQGDKLMARMLYRRIGKQESLVAVHSVATEAGGGGVRWYEFRLGRKGDPQLFQQGTYAPEGDYRWMASPAIDAQGNIGIGYSFGGEKNYPGQRFAGRTAGDPPGILTLRETILVEGEGAQTGNRRWEDYTQTAIDPSDDMTMWYVGDYLKKDARAYSTRIGAFRLPSKSNEETVVTVSFTEARREMIIDLAPMIPNDSLSVRWSPKGEKLPLTELGETMQTVLKLGPAEVPPIKLILMKSKYYDRLAGDWNRNGRLDDDKILTCEPKETRGKIWSSFDGIVDIPVRDPVTGNPAVNPYPLSFWYVLDPAAEVQEQVLRYSRRGWMEGRIDSGTLSGWILLTESQMDGVYDLNDSWNLALPNHKKDLYGIGSRSCTDHCWLGEEAWKIVSIDPSGRRVHLEPYNPAVTRDEELKARDTYAVDRNAPHSGKSVAFLHDFPAAVNLAKESGKRLFIDFETTWCGPCKMMDQWIYTADAVVTGFSDLVGVKVDGDKEPALVKKFSVSGYPTMILLSSDGTEIRRAVGYQSIKEMVALISEQKR